jgi:putative Mg2+ transporter-C (MgtC) family protein
MNWLSFLDSTSTQSHELEIALRLTLASLFGAVIGFERELRDRPAGLRTHMLTAMAAAVFTILTFEIFHSMRAIDNALSLDPIRVIEAVTAGVAFLAAGTIIQSKGKVQGLTTGAGMWLAGAIGVACGAGFYRLAFIAVVLAVLIMVVLRSVEKRLINPNGENGDKD